MFSLGLVASTFNVISGKPLANSYALFFCSWRKHLFFCQGAHAKILCDYKQRALQGVVSASDRLKHRPWKLPALLSLQMLDARELLAGGYGTLTERPQSIHVGGGGRQVGAWGVERDRGLISDEAALKTYLYIQQEHLGHLCGSESAKHVPLVFQPVCGSWLREERSVRQEHTGDWAESDQKNHLGVLEFWSSPSLKVQCLCLIFGFQGPTGKLRTLDAWIWIQVLPILPL